MSLTQSSDSEVLGVTVNVCIDGVMSVFQSRMRNILDENNIEQPDPQPDEWYPLEDFLRVLEVVETDVGENALTKIGEATPQFAEWPTNPESSDEALRSLVDLFEENHRNVSGAYEFERLDDNSARITSTTPYPEAWEIGFMKGAAEIHGSDYTRVNTVETGSERQKAFEIEW